MSIVTFVAGLVVGCIIYPFFDAWWQRRMGYPGYRNDADAMADELANHVMVRDEEGGHCACGGWPDVTTCVDYQYHVTTALLAYARKVRHHTNREAQ